MIHPIERTNVSASNDYRYDRTDPRDRSLRVGDRERDAVSEILRQRHVEGRLDADEFQERVERCLAAKTYAELDALIADFPREEERRSAGEPWRGRPWPLPLVFLPLAAIALIAVGAHLPWLAVPLVFFFVVRPLVWRARGGGYAAGRWVCGPRRVTRV
jgi:hypothetical protein